jgi:hypothetical protein
VRATCVVVSLLLLVGCGGDEEGTSGSAEAFCKLSPEVRVALAAPLTYVPHDFLEAQLVLPQMREDFTQAAAAAPAEIKDDAEQSLAIIVDADEGIDAATSEAEANKVAEEMAAAGAELRDDGSYLDLLEFSAENCPKIDGELGPYP